MKTGILRIACCVIFLLMAGCASQAPISTPTAEPTRFSLPAETPTATFTPTASPTPTLTPSHTPTLPPSQTSTPIGEGRPQYHFNAALDFDAHTLQVAETILYTNQTENSLDSLVLVVDPNRRTNVFVLESISAEGFSVSATLLDGVRLEILLETPLKPNETISLEILYRLNIPPKQEGEVFGYLSYQINLVDWYPFIAPYQDGWIIHKPSGVGEHLVYETSDFDVELKVDGEEDDYLIAASAEGEKNATGTHYQLKKARNFVFSISPIFRSQTEASENARVTSFYFPDYEESGEAILEAAVRAVSIYSQRYAPYPHEHLSVVQTELADGLECDGLVFMGTKFYDEYDGTLKNNLVSVGVHEISHQWWFGLVGNDQAMEPWLDESMALYSERIFYESVDPYPVTWWWHWRVTWFKPSGWVNTSIYDGYAFREYTDAVYLEGALFLEDLRYRIGEKAFNAFLRDYAATYTGKIASSDDFFKTLDRHTDEDYSDIVERYFKP